MKKYEVLIQRASGKEYKYFRAVQINSLVGMAEDMIRDDYKITKITITNLATDEVKVVR